MAEILAYTFEIKDQNGSVIGDVKVYAEDATGGVNFRFDTTLPDGYRIDLNGFFVDTGGDGGAIRAFGTKSNNMNGGNNDGYDYAIALGSVGGNDADFVDGTRFMAGITVADLAGSDAGLRATSYGLDGEGSLKLVAEYTPPPPPPGDDFPLWGQDISNTILVFNTTAGDEKPKPEGDGYYTVKIDNWPNPADDDLDNSIGDIIAWLEAHDPIFMQEQYDASELLMGVIIKGGNQDTNFYAFGDNNLNGTLPDDPPAGLGLTWDGSDNPQPANAVDVSYTYESVLGV
ncbi:hypothetical protein GXW77_19700 [Roseomonas alkaliterrae]|uniref:Uncharacterized protein n=1 Tax=Neoroseomonas alkaliterrae TaxID=1452450 RepID=A0A840Y4V5_9PROT|nr:hypothetical protein [Neoroseomonas alkaliterrae]MBB5691387.1 hypothetical protein [Neoroseomonas alkaliterrae]MBR0678398.1 hypothetical protein [Neoroseomonas alkaliterrae]